MRAAIRSAVATGVLVAGVAGLAGAAMAAPPPRAYERVSTIDTGGRGVADPASSAAAVGENSVVWVTTAVPLGDDPPGPSNVYISRRGAGGWNTSPVVADGFRPVQTYSFNAATSDLSESLLGTAWSYVLGPQGKYDTPYKLVRVGPDGVPRDVVTAFDPATDPYPADGAAAFNVGGFTEDGTAIYDSWRSPAGITASNAREVYRTPREGASTVVSRDGNGDPLGQCGAMVPPAAPPLGPFTRPLNAVSHDGSTVFFWASPATYGPPCPEEPNVIVRRGDTIHRFGDATKRVDFVAADAAGDDAYVTSPGALVASDTNNAWDIYRVTDAATDPSLTCVTCNVSNGFNKDRSVVPSPDGKSVVFATRGAPKLMRASGTTVTEIDPDVGGGFDSTSAAMSLDGAVVFYSKSVGGVEEIFRSAPGSAPECVSCRPDGQPSQFESERLSNVQQSALVGGVPIGRAVSDDGSVVVFRSADPKLPGTSAGGLGTHSNVYEWTAEDGLGLVSAPDTTAANTRPVLTPSGTSIYFNSSDRLTGQEPAGTNDLWFAARRGGGFSPPPAPPEPCGGDDACRGPFTPIAPPTSPASDGEQSVGNAKPTSPPPVSELRITRPTAASWRRLVTTGAMRVKITVTGAGSVRTRLWNVSGHSRRLSSASNRSTAKTEVFRPTVRLSKTWRAKLRRSRSLKVRIIVSMAGAKSQAVSQTIKSDR